MLFYIKFALALLLALAINLALWPSDASTSIDSSDDVTLPQYNPHSTAFAYSKTFAKQFGLDPTGAYDFPEPVLAMRAYIEDRPLEALCKFQFYIDSKANIHLPSDGAALVPYEEGNIGFLGGDELASKGKTRLEQKVSHFFKENMEMIMWQVIAQDSLDEGTKNESIDRYTNNLIPGMTLLETGSGLRATTDRVHIYIGKDSPTMSYTAKVADDLARGVSLSKKAQRDFIAIPLPKKIQDFLKLYCDGE